MRTIHLKDNDLAFLSIEQRMEVFRAVVEAQYNGVPAMQARQQIARQFKLHAAAVQRIEQEGIEGEWPPLS